MKPGLKRIEATLHDLGVHGNNISTETSEGKKRPCSFRISVGKNKPTSQKYDVNHTIEVNVQTEDDIQAAYNSFSQHQSVQAFHTQENEVKTPNLPKFKTPTFSNHRHSANPGFAMTLLQDIQETITGWQTELQTIMQQIQDIYLEGPVINGWLESNTQDKETREMPGGTATLRHGEVEQLMDYVQEICNPENKMFATIKTGYHLCGIDAAGKVWSRECPVDQVPSVSMAIARYQKLRQLFGRKQYLETKLNHLAETLVGLHSDMQQ